jgi:hypothetical protein
MKCRISFLEGTTLITTIVPMVSVLKISVTEAKEMYYHIKNRTKEIWLDYKDVQALEKKFIDVLYMTEQDINTLKEEKEAQEQNKAKLAEAEKWYNELFSFQKEYVDILCSNRQIGPAMG